MAALICQAPAGCAALLGGCAELGGMGELALHATWLYWRECAGSRRKGNDKRTAWSCGLLQSCTSCWCFCFCFALLLICFALSSFLLLCFVLRCCAPSDSRLFSTARGSCKCCRLFRTACTRFGAGLAVALLCVACELLWCCCCCVAFPLMLCYAMRCYAALCYAMLC